jgi:hypothetical protein
MATFNLTRVRVMRDSMCLAEARDQLIQTNVVIRRAAAKASLVKSPTDVGTEEPSEFVLPGVINITGLDKFNFAIVNTLGDHGEFRVGNFKAERSNSFASRRNIDRVKLPQILYKDLISF